MVDGAPYLALAGELHNSSEGVDGTTMEGAALRAGVPKTTLYKRFGDKGLLLRAVIAARVVGPKPPDGQNGLATQGS